MPPGSLDGLDELGRLHLDAVELHRVAMPLVVPIRTVHGERRERDVLLVRVVADGGDVEGWGECVADMRPGYAHEWVDGCAEVLRRFVVPALVAAGSDRSVDLDDVARDHVPGHPLAQAAIRDAVLDALLRRAGRNLADWLGADRRRVTATLTLGLGDEPEPGPYRSVKLKVDGRPPTAEAVDALRRAGVALVAADANGTLATGWWEHVDAAGLDHLEQPLPADDLAGHVALRRRYRTPIALDEAVTSTRAVRSAAALGAADLVVVKPSRLGGVVAAADAVRTARAAGLGVKVGGMYETGIGRAVALAVAALPGGEDAADLSASARYWEVDLTVPFELDDDATLAVPDGPGTGVVPHAGVLAARTTSLTSIRS